MSRYLEAGQFVRRLVRLPRILAGRLNDRDRLGQVAASGERPASRHRQRGLHEEVFGGHRPPNLGDRVVGGLGVPQFGVRLGHRKAARRS